MKEFRVRLRPGLRTMNNLILFTNHMCLERFEKIKLECIAWGGKIVFGDIFLNLSVFRENVFCIPLLEAELNELTFSETRGIPRLNSREKLGNDF